MRQKKDFSRSALLTPLATVNIVESPMMKRSIFDWQQRAISSLAVFAFFCAGALSALCADHTPRIDNDQARVLVVTSAADAKSSLHDHKVNRVMIYLDAGKMTLTETNGHVQKLNFKAGQALWSPASGLHISHNISGHPVRIVEIELKNKPAQKGATKFPALDPVKVDPKRYRVEMENDQVRVLRVRYGAHEKGVTHEHTLNRVVTFITDGEIKVTTPDGESKTLKVSAGDMITGGAATHVEENLSDRPFEVVVVEFKS
jgi:quercetin dioxygenase-like cupin family protein